jgi:drug/metabolite transporter (DMT)-like permease
MTDQLNKDGRIKYVAPTESQLADAVRFQRGPMFDMAWDHRSRSMARMALLALLWGSVFLWIKLAITHGLSPVQVAAARCALGSVVLFGLARVFKQRIPRDMATWRRLFAAAFLCNFLPFLLFNIGEKTVDSGLAGALHATTPLWSLLLGLAIGTESLNRWVRVCGLALGFLGVSLIFAPWQGQGLLRGGSIAILIAAASYACAFAYMARNLTSTSNGPIAMSAAQLIAATVWCLAALPFDTSAQGTFDTTALIAIVMLGVFGTGVTFYLNYRLIADEGPTNAATVGYLLPIVSLALGYFVLGEPLGLRALAGTLVVLAGVALAKRGKLSRQKA